MSSIFITSDIFRGSSYGKGHPLNIQRVWPVLDLCKAFGWIKKEQLQFVPPAKKNELLIFHTNDYIDALYEAEQHQELSLSKKNKFKIGVHPNPIFKEVYSRPATAVKANIIGVNYLFEGKFSNVFNPSGGTHHGFKNKANGFCFVNDPAIAITLFLKKGAKKVSYVDIDAHHPDGVEHYFFSEKNVQLISIHEKNRWPYTGKKHSEKNNVFNYPVPRGTKDDILTNLINNHIIEKIKTFECNYLIIQAGCDGLEGDPQSLLSYTNIGYWKSIKKLLELELPTLILGGGGYNPYLTARAWAGIWGIINKKNVFEKKCNAKAKKILGSLEFYHRLGKNIPSKWIEQLHD